MSGSGASRKLSAVTAILLAGMLALAACQAEPGDAGRTALAAPEEAQCIPPATSWRRTATADDRARLRGWREAWEEALGQARTSGHAAELAAEGALLDPDAALPNPVPPAGLYACRTLKLGSPEAGLTYVTYPAFRCRIVADALGLRLVKETGSQRPVGRLYVDRDRRMVFLGTMQLGDESRAYRYGIDRERDVAGLFERVGPNRWRLTIPSPRFESLLDVIELIPAR